MVKHSLGFHPSVLVVNHLRNLNSSKGRSPENPVRTNPHLQMLHLPQLPHLNLAQHIPGPSANSSFLHQSHSPNQAYLPPQLPLRPHSPGTVTLCLQQQPRPESSFSLVVSCASKYGTMSILFQHASHLLLCCKPLARSPRQGWGMRALLSEAF
jgi:hypothetical protein